MKSMMLLLGVLLTLWICNDGVTLVQVPNLEPPHLRDIPPRSEHALTGSAFAHHTRDMTEQERQQAALSELLCGNIPEFLRTLKPVQVLCNTDEGYTVSAMIWVMPDYLAIGSDDDFLRIPLSYPVATEVALAFGCILPTRKMVDAIYAQASCQLKPQPMKPGSNMRSMAYFVEHQRKIEVQRVGRPLGELVSGHKKDVVLTNRLLSKPNRIAIYGWHWSNGEPIQPLSTAHGARYADYSHGIRLISQSAWFEGKVRSVFDLLEDPSHTDLLTDEGVALKAKQLLYPGRI